MNKERKKVTLNRAVFAQRAFDSSALTVLTTLLHSFPEPGQYEWFVQQQGRNIYRGAVHVISDLRRAQQENASRQINVDLATLGRLSRDSREGCDCQSDHAYVLSTGGILGFYPSKGVGRYTVTISQITNEKKVTALDSATAVPQGDFFAITLVLPGIYTVTNHLTHSQMKIEVTLPRRGEGYRPDQATLIQAGEGGFEPDSASIYAGQSIVFQCTISSRFVVELVQADPSIVDRPTSSGGERPRYTVRKRPVTPDTPR